MNLLGHYLDGERHTKTLLEFLKKQGVEVITELDDRAIIVLFKQKWYIISDNGGELIVSLINAKNLTPDVPTMDSMG